MTKRITTYIATCLCCLGCMLPANAQLSREYTADRPLTIVSDWEFPPYEFRNDRGEPDGYNVEVLDLILKRLEIPHKFVMQEWYLCTRTFENREADLIHALSANYRKRPYVMTQNLITYYPVKMVRTEEPGAAHKNQPALPGRHPDAEKQRLCRLTHQARAGFLIQGGVSFSQGGTDSHPQRQKLALHLGRNTTEDEDQGVCPRQSCARRD